MLIPLLASMIMMTDPSGATRWVAAREGLVVAHGRKLADGACSMPTVGQTDDAWDIAVEIDKDCKAVVVKRPHKPETTDGGVEE
jgi:hypothetical protein